MAANGAKEGVNSVVLVDAPIVEALKTGGWFVKCLIVVPRAHDAHRAKVHPIEGRLILQDTRIAEKDEHGSRFDPMRDRDRRRVHPTVEEPRRGGDK